jgi:hypothetical protein
VEEQNMTEWSVLSEHRLQGTARPADWATSLTIQDIEAMEMAEESVDIDSHSKEGKCPWFHSRKFYHEWSSH